MINVSRVKIQRLAPQIYQINIRIVLIHGLFMLFSYCNNFIGKTTMIRHILFSGTKRQNIEFKEKVRETVVYHNWQLTINSLLVYVLCTYMHLRNLQKNGLLFFRQVTWNSHILHAIYTSWFFSFDIYWCLNARV